MNTPRLLIAGIAIALLSVVIGVWMMMPEQLAIPARAPGAGGANGMQAAPDPEREKRLRRKLIDAASQAEGEWIPEATLPDPGAAESVEETLAAADAALALGHLIEPMQGSALASYRAVLAADPNNERAQEGLETVVASLLVNSQQAIAERDPENAGPWIAVLRELRPDDPSVLLLVERLAQERQLAGLLKLGQARLDAGQIIVPEGDSALEFFREAAVLDPASETARQGLADVEHWLLEQAVAAATARDFTTADRMLNLAGGLRSDSQTVLDTQARILRLRREHGEQLARTAQQTIEAGEFVRAAAMIEEIERLGVEPHVVEQLSARLESAQLYSNFSPGQVFEDSFIASDGVAPPLVVIAMGSFQLGSPSNEDGRRSSEGPRHRVEFARGFAIGQTEVTVAQFAAFVEDSAYRTEAELARGSGAYDEETGRIKRQRRVHWKHGFDGSDASPDSPVIHVTWNDAKAYVDWLSLKTGQRYRLPGEAEFEYVLRAGSQTRYPWGDGAPSRVLANLTGAGDRSRSGRSWSDAFSDYRDGWWGPAPVKSFPANAWGVFDLEGNVSEWVEDCWHDSFIRAPDDGRAWVNPGCDKRVVRGASWGSAPDQARAAYRLSAAPDTRGPRVGIRVARDL